MIQPKLIAEFHGSVTPETTNAYFDHEFTVPDGVQRLRARLRYRKDGVCQLYLHVFGPDGYRGSRMLPGAIGEIAPELEFGDGFASLGAIAGPIQPGAWRVQLSLERTEHAADYAVTVEASSVVDQDTNLEPFTPAPQNGRAGAGWYRGELHSHSHHSDGKAPVRDVVSAARRSGLDFLALTDHFTTAGWRELEALSDEKLCVMRGLELTGHAGHANMHGLKEWVNPFVDDPSGTGPSSGWTINDAARATRDQGGLFCVNHAFALDLGWRYHDFDWKNADLMEVYHHLEGEGNTAQLGLWDGLLRAGHRITGVAGTDSHDPHAGRHRLGQVYTVVHSESLEPPSIIEGLRRGRAYVSLGPKLSFNAVSGSARAGLGDELHADSGVRFEIGLENLTHPARVILMKNGFYHTHFDVPASLEPHVLTCTDEPGRGGAYYRLEVFARPAQVTAPGAGRDWQHTLALTNPIYVPARS